MRAHLRIAVQKEMGKVFADGKFIRKSIVFYCGKSIQKPLAVCVGICFPNGKIRTSGQAANVFFIKCRAGASGNQKWGKYDGL